MLKGKKETNERKEKSEISKKSINKNTANECNILINERNYHKEK